ncbi:MAG: hypothetical protein PHT69_08335 [Bacteroidales bacterium]|nr:hypothetical protein [Bacteroidales bacterium]
MSTRNVIILFFICIIFMYSCKEKELQPPVINFKTGSQYTQNGDVVEVGHQLLFGIQARSDNSEITNFTIKKRLEDGTVIPVMDTALYSNYMDIDKKYFQNVESKVTWIFTVMDRDRLTAQLSMDVFKDPNSQFGGIFYFPSIKLGFQNNTSYGQFLNPFDGTVYKADSSHLYQEEIEILCYFKNDDTPPGPALSSPGEMDNFSTDAQTIYPTIVNWQTRNYTLWDISVEDNPIPVQAFDAAQNDSLLIVSFDPIWGKKKFKWATAGKIIPFQTSGGKLGLIKVISSDNTDSGYMEIALKIQQ